MSDAPAAGLTGFNALRELDLGERAPYAASVPDRVVRPGRPDAPAADGGPLCGAASRLAASTTSALDLLSASVASIKATEDVVQAWTHLDLAGARTVAASAPGQGPGRLPLAGIPVGVKDLVDVAGMPTRAGSRHFAEAGPATTDSPIVTLLRAAGAIVVGKCNTHEFAFGGTTPPTTNPRDRQRIPGGSSGGSAAAVAAGHVPLAVGTDTAGSVRIPAAYCGIVGFIPTAGLVSNHGIAPLAWSLDRIGLITTTAADLAYASEALGFTTPSHGQLAGLRIGVLADAFDAPVEQSVKTAVRAAIAQIESAGAVVQSVHVPHERLSVLCSMPLMIAESADYHRERLQLPGLFGDDVRAALALSDGLLAADLVRAHRVRALIAEEWRAVFTDVDVVVGPALPRTAPTIAEAEAGVLTIDGVSVPLADAHLRYFVAANLAGLPAGTQPCGRDERGLPVGLHWVAAAGADDVVLQAMLGFEGIGR